MRGDTCKVGHAFASRVVLVNVCVFQSIVVSFPVGP